MAADDFLMNNDRRPLALVALAGLAVAAVGFSVSLTGIGMIVPSEVVCGLLGRV